MLFLKKNARLIFQIVFALLLFCSVVALFVDLPKEQWIRGLTFLMITLNYIFISVDQRGWKKTAILGATILVSITLSVILLNYASLIFGESIRLIGVVLSILLNLFIYLKVMNKLDGGACL